jgi:hypothetical protein
MNNAKICYNDDGEIHRLDGPAVEFPNGRGILAKES